ncbi:CDP-diacylglycerol--serine O-phosphatidyltransferase [Paenibacillus cellulosilyticus]|uniref:CDP-diacylglycerol--serine O-phosphatidyltransferase n=1 Tax=Paenibacillus cellulosilyticus TaxID=375489 RepID=A0A2V2YQI8_9BACL|nr:CDP-alcohol phosphatidyltransferase family protein [Paenibacillus cellulosilyticus]PWV99361.1 CDP-diacylglycerol--serine O-phosphatidyltransferase [Paenibacillus cellulosilyticus]QKS45125.1 CDP-alcohol phosphatidyltransferase family protein [Paenibacillus cellulosilyticus]
MVKWFPALKYWNLANAITTCGVVCGMLAMLLFVQGHNAIAFTLYGAAILGDYVDGIIARKLKQTSTFGQELDSLADAISFCVLPAFAGYALGVTSPLGIAALLLYAVTGLWRLAYFNVNGLEGAGQHSYYTGIPTTIAASWLLVLSPLFLAGDFPGHEAVLAVIYVICGLLMLSAVPFKKNGWMTKILYVLLPAAVIVDWLIV